VETTGSPWNADAAEVVIWSAHNPAFDQDRAMEASGLTAVGDVLYTVAEKYGAALRLAPGDPWTAEVVPLDVPPLTELEGVAHRDGVLYMCDEKHAAVYRVPLDPAGDGGQLSASPLTLEGVAVSGGKIGLEGVAVGADDRLFLLLERSREPDGGCVSVIYPMDIGEHELVAAGAPLVLDLEDCNWRLTGLELRDGRLVGLKTRYPGEEYQIVEIDPASGEWSVLMDITELARALEEEGWGNNLEGVAIGPGGDLFMISDNAVTDISRTPEPPPGRDRTLLLRLPAAETP
jgi:hypothetical protein